NRTTILCRGSPNLRGREKWSPQRSTRVGRARSHKRVQDAEHTFAKWARRSSARLNRSRTPRSSGKTTPNRCLRFAVQGACQYSAASAIRCWRTCSTLTDRPPPSSLRALRGSEQAGHADVSITSRGLHPLGGHRRLPPQLPLGKDETFAAAAGVGPE